MCMYIVRCTRSETFVLVPPIVSNSLTLWRKRIDTEFDSVDDVDADDEEDEVDDGFSSGI